MTIKRYERTSIDLSVVILPIHGESLENGKHRQRRIYQNMPGFVRWESSLENGKHKQRHINEKFDMIFDVRLYPPPLNTLEAVSH